ncbi:hypothetical protein D3C81_2122580 [compost metagenome]
MSFPPSLIYIHTAEYLNHLFAKVACNLKPVLGSQLIHIQIKKIILQFNFFNEHLCVKNIGLIYIHINCVVFGQCYIVNIVLN